MDKILELKLPQPGDPNQRVVAILREALKDAKAGRIQGVGIGAACVDADGDGCRSTETYIAYADGWAHSTSAAVAGLFTRLNVERYQQGSALPAGKLTDEDE